MRCTSRNESQRYRRHRRNRRSRRRRVRRFILAIVLVIIVAVTSVLGVMSYRDSKRNYTAEYERAAYNSGLYQGELFAEHLCVASTDVALDGFTDNTGLHAAGLFDVDKGQVLYGYHLFDQLYPASTTKIMTAYVALKYGNLNDTVTVSEHATDLEWDSSVCWLQTGDTLSLYDLLCGLLLQSGNDAGIAIAEHVAGSEEEFVSMMNEEAAKMGATGTHFTNPHGLQDVEHYTTAYDLYLMFYTALQDERFQEILEMDSYTVTITGADGAQRTLEWSPTNYYATGEAQAPEGVQVLGGKTGTTDEAGSCLVLYSRDMEEHPYISVVMGADEKTVLYDEMTALLASGIVNR